MATNSANPCRSSPASRPRRLRLSLSRRDSRTVAGVRKPPVTERGQPAPAGAMEVPPPLPGLLPPRPSHRRLAPTGYHPNEPPARRTRRVTKQPLAKNTFYEGDLSSVALDVEHLAQLHRHRTRVRI
jgi:hypothetical protein